MFASALYGRAKLGKIMPRVPSFTGVLLSLASPGPTGVGGGLCVFSSRWCGAWVADHAPHYRCLAFSGRWGTPGRWAGVRIMPSACCFWPLLLIHHGQRVHIHNIFFICSRLRCSPSLGSNLFRARCLKRSHQHSRPPAVVRTPIWVGETSDTAMPIVGRVAVSLIPCPTGSEP